MHIAAVKAQLGCVCCMSSPFSVELTRWNAALVAELGWDLWDCWGVCMCVTDGGILSPPSAHPCRPELPTLFLVFCSFAASTILHSPSDWRTSMVVWHFWRLSPTWTNSVKHHLNNTQQKSKTRHALPSVVFGLFNYNLNKLAHNQCLGCLSKSSLSSKPPSKYGLLYSFCTAPWLLSTLWSSARGSLSYGTSLRYWLSPKSPSSSITELRTKMSLETSAVSPLNPHLLCRYCAPHSTAILWDRLIPESVLLMLLLSKAAYINNISITWFLGHIWTG